MSVVKVKDLREMNRKTLEQKIDSLRKSFFSLKMEAGTTGASKPHLMSSYKKNIAQCMTVLKELNK